MRDLQSFSVAKDRFGCEHRDLAVGPITLDLASLTDGEEVYSARTSIFFKRTHVYRTLDKKRNTLVYLAISDKLIEGSPQNSISTVPIMPWSSNR